MALGAALAEIQSQASEVLRAFDLHPAIVQSQPSPTRCAVFWFTSANREYALKVYPNEYTVSELESELLFVRHLLAHGLPVPRYVSALSGEYFAAAPTGYRSTVYEWVPGTIKPIVQRAELLSLASLIAAIHLASQRLDVLRQDEWLWADAIHCLGGVEPPPDVEDWLHGVIDTGRPWSLGGDLRICHNDYSVKNAIWSDGNVWPSLIDFTNAILAPFEWDIAIACADIFLKRAYPGTIKDVFDAIFLAYSKAGGMCRQVLAMQLLRVAIAQRAVFQAHTQDKSTRAITWETVSAARLYID